MFTGRKSAKVSVLPRLIYRFNVGSQHVALWILANGCSSLCTDAEDSGQPEQPWRGGAEAEGGPRPTSRLSI